MIPPSQPLINPPHKRSYVPGLLSVNQQARKLILCDWHHYKMYTSLKQKPRVQLVQANSSVTFIALNKHQDFAAALVCIIPNSEESSP